MQDLDEFSEYTNLIRLLKIQIMDKVSLRYISILNSLISFLKNDIQRYESIY